jgi:hypothetical protein
MASLPLTNVNQRVQRGAPSRGVSLTIQVQEASYDVQEVSNQEAHLRFMLCLHTLTTDQSESKFNVRLKCVA